MTEKPDAQTSILSRSLDTLRQPYTVGLISAVLAAILINPTLHEWLLPPNKSAKPTVLYLNVMNDSGKPIANASVILGEGSRQVTDDLGVVRINVKQSGEVAARIAADGYTPLFLSIPLPRSDPNITAVLTPSRTSENGQPRAPYVEVVRSGPRASGVGAEFSAWYELVSPPPRPGYVVDFEHTQFSLSGDRRCNEWSECQLKRISDEQIVFLFRLQGHSESFPQRPALSEGILRVQYKAAVPQVQNH